MGVDAWNDKSRQINCICLFIKINDKIRNWEKTKKVLAEETADRNTKMLNSLSVHIDLNNTSHSSKWRNFWKQTWLIVHLRRKYFSKKMHM